jgi:PAS domain S-box-containing protein
MTDDRQRAAEAEVLPMLIEAVRDYAIFMLSPDGVVRTWNHGAQRIKGYAPAEIIGQHFSVFYTPEDRAAGHPDRILNRALAEGRAEDQGWRVRKDGTRFWADVVVSAIYDQSGRHVGFGKVTRDLTERRRAERQQRALEVEREARAAAEQSLLARDRFLSIASHELKTPVASVQLATETLIRSLDAGRLDDERLRAGLARVTTASKRLASLIGELLDVSRLTSDQQDLEFEPTDFGSLVEEVVARFEDLHNGGRITVRVAGDVRVPADPSRLDQVVTNLVDNALKYSTAPAPVEVSVTGRDDGVELTVEDRGVGLDAEAGERLFEAFGRGSNVEHVHGLGLGLYISYRIVERHGGRIEAAAREDGPGTSFRVWLPRRIPARRRGGG